MANFDNLVKSGPALQQEYFNLFSTAAGRRVLMHMLGQLGYWRATKGPEEEALRGYAVVLLHNIGIGEDPKEFGPEVLDGMFRASEFKIRQRERKEK